MEALKHNFSYFDCQVNASFSQQMNFIFSKINFDSGGGGGFVGGIGVGGLGAVALMFFTGLGLIPIILAGVTAGIAGSFCLGLFIRDKLR